MKSKKALFITGIIILTLCALFLLTAILTDLQGIIYLLIGLIPAIAGGAALVIIGKRKPIAAQAQPVNKESILHEKADRSTDVYIMNQNGNIVGRADGKPISDEEIPYLIEQGFQSTLEKQESPRRSSRDDELSFQFFYKHGAESQKRSDAFLDHARNALKTNDINERIQLLEETIDLFYKARDWHYKTKGGMLYFQDTWEHCFNARNSDFCWVENEEIFLKESLFERDEIEPWILKHAEDGFMQPEIYKAFPAIQQSMLRKSIDRLVALEKIEKNKEGKTYKITILK